MEVRRTDDGIEYGNQDSLANSLHQGGAQSGRTDKIVDPFYEKDIKDYVKVISKPVSSTTPTRASDNDAEVSYR